MTVRVTVCYGPNGMVRTGVPQDLSYPGSDGRSQYVTSPLQDRQPQPLGGSRH